jgi:2-amino-4-hydroxy-6-hydroxymethyldihydropteridine diphosphokinase
LGSNLSSAHGGRVDHLDAAVDRLDATPGVEVEAVSPWIETDPVGPAAPAAPVVQGAYLNGVARVRTTLSPRALLDRLHAIERALGRDRERETVRWGPRTIDLDILLIADLVVDEPGLTVPHPRMQDRAFVLEPLCAIDPGLRHPTLGQTAAELLEVLRVSQGDPARGGEP